MRYILSFSGGKDSTYLLLELIRRNYPLDEVVFFDTGWEYDVMYEHVEKCKQFCEDHNVLFTVLHPDHDFDYLMFEHRTRSGKKGYSWCGGTCRWGTSCKLQVLDRFARNAGECIIYIGIAADEGRRLEKEWASFKRFPLVEWGITEEECLQGCYDAGFDWGGMYEHLDRLSCKYCKNKNLKELRNIRIHYPKVWNELREYQLRTNRPYKGEGKSVFDLEKRFIFEDAIREKGIQMNRRQFFDELRRRLKDPQNEVDTERFPYWDYEVDSVFYDDEADQLMQSVTTVGGDVDVAPYYDYEDWRW